ncbi:MAG: hypothetical protein LBN23_08515 [Paludibacter sp.]|jgi:hypothetical protein|nr:hypothetical protein [Paludibacter sp.]
MKKSIIILLFLGFIFGFANAQTPRAVSIELLGVYNLAGISFDSRFTENSKFGYKVGAGYGFGRFTAFFEYKSRTVAVPANIYYLFGKKHHFFELGLGMTSFYYNRYFYDGIYGQESRFAGIGSYGFLQTAYRFESSKFLISAGLDFVIQTPVIIRSKVSIGYRL